MAKEKPPVGASAKMEAARKLKESGFFDRERRGGGGARNFGGEHSYPSQLIPVTIIFVIGVLIALFISWSDANPLAGLHITGIPLFDNFMTSSTPTAFTADPDVSKVLTLMLRGLAFFILAGIAPAIAFVLERTAFHKKVPPLLLCWGAILVTAGLCLFVPLSSILPASFKIH
jgi:hypothetical protein